MQEPLDLSAPRRPPADATSTTHYIAKARAKLKRIESRAERARGEPDGALESLGAELDLALNLLESAEKERQELAERLRLVSAIHPDRSRLRARTRREDAQSRLRNAFYRCAVERAPDPISVVGQDGTIRFHGPDHDHVLDYAKKEVVGTSVTELVHPEDREHAAAAFGAVKSSPGARAIRSLRLRHHDGGWRPVEVHARSLITDPAVQGVLTVTRRAEN